MGDVLYAAAREKLIREMTNETLASLTGDNLRVALTAAVPGRMPDQLRDYWTHGEGAAKIRWGTDGSFDRCVRLLRKYFPNDPKGLCARLHKRATGEWPAEKGIESSAGFAAPSETDYDLEPELDDEAWMAEWAFDPSQPRAVDGKWAGGAVKSKAQQDTEKKMGAGEKGKGLSDAEFVEMWAEGQTLKPGEAGSERYRKLQARWDAMMKKDPKVMIAIMSRTRTARAAAAKKARAAAKKKAPAAKATPKKAVTAHAGHDLDEVDSMDAALAFLDEPDEFVDSIMPLVTRWDGMLAPIGKPTGDRRIFEPGALSNRDLPVPLMWQEKTDDGHARSSVVGTIESLDHREDGTYGAGRFLDPDLFPDAQKAMALMKARVNGPSVDLDDVTYAMKNADGTPFDPAHFEAEMLAGNDPAKPLLSVSSGRISGATLVSIPAFAEVAHTWTLRDVPDEDSFSAALAEEMDDCPDCFTKAEALAAAAGYSGPPLDAFLPREFAGPTGLTVTDDGMVFGHLAAWGTCHVGYPGTCVTPPQSKSSYAYFHTGEVTTAEGERIAVGRLVLGAPHADLAKGFRAAAQHYDDTGRVVALVRAYEDAYGIAFSGVLVHDLTPQQRAEFAAMPLSGDWRRVGGAMELIGAISVPVPGFPVARGRAGEPAALVAAGIVHSTDAQPVDDPQPIRAEVLSTVRNDDGSVTLTFRSLDPLTYAMLAGEPLEASVAEASGPEASEEFADLRAGVLADVAATLDRERMALLDGLDLGE